MTESLSWLSRHSDNHLTTPYGRLLSAQHVIAPYAYGEGTTTKFDISRDGQSASYSKDGLNWHTVDFRKWPHFLATIAQRLKDTILGQFPSGLVVSDLIDGPMVDDLTKLAPHRQGQNRQAMEAKLEIFKAKMLSATETRHKLLKISGELDTVRVRRYIEQDQQIRGLLSAYIAASSGVPMRAFQFASIAFDSGQGFDRNWWAHKNCFFLGKPKAKQTKIAFADILSSIPEELTSDLSTLFFYEQPFICYLLDGMGFAKDEHRYATHVWPLVPKKGSLNAAKLWSGPQISQSLKDISHEVIGSVVDPALMRQIAEGLLREKVPSLFEAFHSRHNVHQEIGSYQFPQCLQSYADYKGLQSLVNAAEMSLQRAAACLIVVEIWRSMHKVQLPNPIWQPMVESAFLFPTNAHIHLAHMSAQNLTQTASITYQRRISQDSLTRGLKSLSNNSYSELVVSQICLNVRMISYLIFRQAL